MVHIIDPFIKSWLKLNIETVLVKKALRRQQRKKFFFLELLQLIHHIVI